MLRIVPHRIKHFPSVVLDVVLSTTIECAPVGFPAAAPSLAPVALPADTPINHPTGPYRPDAITNLLNPPPASATKGSETNSTMICPESVPGVAIAADPSTDVSLTEPLHSTMTRRTTTHIQRQLKSVTAAVEHATESGNPLDSAAIMALINSKLVSTSTASAAIVIADESHFREYMVEKVDGLTAICDEIGNNVIKALQNQQLMLDRLALIQQKAEGILFRTKFRLHFICECGEHTKPTGNAIPHHLHLAKHEGYAINKPTEFFEKYGPSLMLMLEMLKVGANVAAISSVTSKVIEGVDYTLAYLEQNRAQIQNPNGVDIDDDARLSMQDLTSYLNGVEGLEGTDLRQLGSFLAANSSDNLLGNLYRMMTDKGHVNFDICTTMPGLDSGEYCTVSLGSKIRAAEFFDALAKARRIDDLNITFDWECDRRDLESLRDALGKSRLSVEMVAGSIGGKEFRILAETLKTNSALTTLDLRDNKIRSKGAQALAKALKTNSTLTI
ncbi:hypothetical protein BGZ70_001457 [Mortierella alpina]|uniref:RNI-like protein n=1 Tax=Mortierella alpina TaxID=64518 RepID=A0A9P6IVT8_MORAP|nr:hypothetical protein BGZ70_001457 [Mortierella alpina]